MLEIDEEKIEEWLKLVEKHVGRLDTMNYEFYPLDSPSMSGKVEQAVFVFEVLEIYHMLDPTIQIKKIKEYNEKAENSYIIDGFTFEKNGIPYYIALTETEPPQGYKVIEFGKSQEKDIEEKENKLINIFGLFNNGATIYSHFHEKIGE